MVSGHVGLGGRPGNPLFSVDSFGFLLQSSLPDGCTGFRVLYKSSEASHLSGFLCHPEHPEESAPRGSLSTHHPRLSHNVQIRSFVHSILTREILFTSVNIDKMATSVQDMSRPGEEVDLYYYDSECSKKQAFGTTQNTKYVQAFANLTGGSSVFTIPPNNGIQDIVVAFNLPALSGTSGQLAAIALPRGWGYQLIKQVSFRYGGSSQYFLTGDQIFQSALRAQTSLSSADAIATLGGNVATGSGGASGNLDAPLGQYANVVLRLPHSLPSGVGKSHPFPTDLLTQQCQITLELNPVSSLFAIAAGAPSGTAAVVPTALASAYFQVQQVMFNNQGDSLARRVDMSVNAYAFPCEFTQIIQRIPLTNSVGPQSVVCTGFRAGEVKALHCWLSRASDSATNPFRWYLPTSVEMTYAGDVYARYNNASSPLWNLVNGNKPPAFDNVILTDSGSQTWNTSSALSQWVELPFAQTLVDEDSHYILTHGKPITNGIVNLLVTTPSGQTDWVLNVSYIYNATLLFSQGTVDYVF